MSYTKAEMKVMFAWGIARGSMIENLRKADGVIDAKVLDESVEESFESLLRRLKDRKLEKQQGVDTNKLIQEYFDSDGKRGNPPIPGLIKE